ncbi:MAG: Uma2 family endonuclease [Coleofasciculus sp. B1-GNL1-01]|uniref:Uma2 family endonuclease n=1 Tax=Coleofasciculus sp. B1-GNL1-01 TaxID=3068484 RepID=UPI0032F6E401
MTIQLTEQQNPVNDQYFILPGRYNWQQFKAIQAVMQEVPGLKLTYLDGCVEFMTTGEDHEMIKKFLAILIEAYLFETGIRFIPIGNATREAEMKGASFAPDESYYIGTKKDHPDLAIEVALTSGGTDKLKKYKRFQIPEVWFWQKNKIFIYRFRQNDYEQVERSEFLPKLDLELLVRCVLMSDIVEARMAFINGIRQNKS